MPGALPQAGRFNLQGLMAEWLKLEWDYIKEQRRGAGKGTEGTGMGAELCPGAREEPGGPSCAPILG